jgi:tRNA threonylcarbamoyladenosine biosynthesis protein TsaB
VIVLGFDTATPATAVALRLGDGSTLQVRDDPGVGERPGHTTRLLGFANELLESANIGWSALERIAVGRGPGSFTGLRVGMATARGLAQSLGIELVGVSSLRALAEGGRTTIGEDQPVSTGPVSPGPASAVSAGSAGTSQGTGRATTSVLAVLDARRGEAFAAAYLLTERESAEELVPPCALAPEDLGSIVEQAEAREGANVEGMRWQAVGDGAVLFRAPLEAAGVVVLPDSSPLHLLGAEAICAIGARAEPIVSQQAVLPDYRRRPDAEIALEGSRARKGGNVCEGGNVSEGARAREGTEG